MRRLLSLARSVRVVDNFSTGFRSNLEKRIDRIELVEGDVSEFDDDAFSRD